MLAAVNICSDSGVQENKVCHYFHCFSVCCEFMGPDDMILVFFNVECFEGLAIQ